MLRFRQAIALSALVALAPHTGSGADHPITPVSRASSTRTDQAIPVRPASGEISKLVARLDAPHYQSRDQAMRALAAAGQPAVPFLVRALGDSSSELRFRAQILLCQHNSFEDVAPHLVDAVDRPYGVRARVILRERALWQVDIACEWPFTERLLKFWGTEKDAFRHNVLTALEAAKTETETARIIEPLLGFREKTDRFNEAISRLESLSLSYDHRYSPGYVIAETLALGLATNHAGWTSFADQHLKAFERLVSELQQQEEPSYAIRKEVSDRANMSQGAAGFLVQVLDHSTPQRKILVEQVDIQPEDLQGGFCRGLSSAEHGAYDRGVGRVHIADMLTEEIREWPAIPADGVVQQLVAGARQTAVEGNKPKALAFLDALEACRDLPNHQLSLTEGVGRQLAERLQRAAVDAPNIRVYHPARNVYDRLVALIDSGVAPTHEAFPQTLFTSFIQEEVAATSDSQRLALERYLRILERLRAVQADFDRPGAKQFVATLRDGVTTRHELLAEGVAQLDQLLRASQDSAPDTQALDLALGQWTRSQAEGR